jgi:hypothetical protein
MTDRQIPIWDSRQQNNKRAVHKPLVALPTLWVLSKGRSYPPTSTDLKMGPRIPAMKLVITRNIRPDTEDTERQGLIPLPEKSAVLFPRRAKSSVPSGFAILQGVRLLIALRYTAYCKHLNYGSLFLVLIVLTYSQPYYCIDPHCAQPTYLPTYPPTYRNASW